MTLAKRTIRATEPARAAAKLPSLAVRKNCFIERLRQTANVSRAAREAGLASSLLYRHRKTHPAFARAWDDALAEALDALEDAVMDRVINGVAKPVFHGGKQVGELRTYSDAMSMFVLRSKRPEIYNRTAGAVAVLPSEMTEEEAEAEMNRRLERLRSV